MMAIAQVAESVVNVSCRPFFGLDCSVIAAHVTISDVAVEG